MTERRAYPRIAQSSDVRIKIISVTGMPEIKEKHLSCTTSDISMRGVCLQMDVHIPPGTKIELVVNLGQDLGMHEHSGRVAWCKENETYNGDQGANYQTGIAFDTTKSPQYSDWKSAILLLLQKGVETSR